MTLSDISIRRPVFAWMLMAGLIMFGLISVSRMGVSQLPDVDFPVISISVNYPGASPEIVETNVIDILEDAVMSVEGVRNVSSTSRYGAGRISVEFDLSRDIDQALQEVQAKVAGAQRTLPPDLESPILRKSNPEDQPIMWMSVTSTKASLPELMRYVKDHLKDRFSSLPGVGEVLFGGYVEPNLRVWISEKKLDRYNLTASDVINAIQKQHVELPAGLISTPRTQFDVRTLGEATTPEEFGNIVINQRGGSPIYTPILLKQVASVEDGTEDIGRISRANGVRAVGIGIRKQRGANTVEVAHEVKQRMAQVNTRLPDGMAVAVNFDSTQFIEDSVNEFKFALLMSAVVTSLVVWLFLGSWSSTLNILMAIPTSIIGTFIIIYFFGFTLNTFTLLGLSLAIGIVVDDAIMVLENIVRHREMGEDRITAALNGTRQITFAALAATLAVVAIFLPVAFMTGVIGQFFYQFGVTMTAAVLLSLLEALTLTSMRASQFVEPGNRKTKIGRAIDAGFTGLSNLYHRSLGFTLRHPWWMVIASLIFFAVSVNAVRFINKEFMPVQDQSSFVIRARTPIDSSLEYTNERAKQAEKVLMAHQEVRRVYSAVGGFGSGGQSNLFNIFVSLKQPKERGVNPKFGHVLTQQELMGVVRKELKALKLKASIRDLSQRGFGSSRGFPVEFSLQGPEWDKLVSLSKLMEKKMEATGLMTDIDDDYISGAQEARVIPNRAEAAARGVSVETIAQTIRTMVGGTVAGQYSSGGHRYDIRVSMKHDQLQDPDQLKHFYVRNNRGELVRLADVVKIQRGTGPVQINRNDRERSIKITANVADGKSQQAALSAAKQIAEQNLPSNYHADFTGGSQAFNEAFSGLLFVMILGIIVSYMVLASQFNSFIHPFTVLIALPFSVSGAFLSLWLAGDSLNIFSYIGLILLMGIVKKNSILLVDFTNQVRAQRPVSIREALHEACPIRLRPILMTSFATIAAALPLALSLGPGAELRAPMAVAVIGGVLVSSLLTLYVVPAVYELLSRFERIPPSGTTHQLEVELPPERTDRI